MPRSERGSSPTEWSVSPPSPTQSSQVSAGAGSAMRADFYRTSTGARATTSGQAVTRHT
jgi:hypothetical protein